MNTQPSLNETQSTHTVKTYKIKDLLSGATYEWTVQDILNEINRDRSSEWIDYDDTDWREGWNEWVEGEYLSIH